MLIKLILRNLKRYSFLNLIKIIGLALSLCGVLFIALFIKNELSFDKYHPNAECVYRFTTTSPDFLNNTHFARMVKSAEIPDLAEYFPEIEKYVRLKPVKGGVVMSGNNYININQGYICDSTFFEIFEAELVLGDKKTVLNQPASMVMSESFARKVFGNEDPIGKVITIPPGQYYMDEHNFTIQGVMKDFPQNSHFHPDFVTTHDDVFSWWAFIYLQLYKNANPENIINGYSNFLAERNNIAVDEVKTEAHLQKLTDIHLYSHKLREIEVNNTIVNIYVLVIAAILLLVIAFINYASLNLGMSGYYERFLSINKILGSSRLSSLKYFLTESAFIIMISVVIALFVSIPLNAFIGIHFSLALFKGNTLSVILMLILFAVFALIAGIQPVWNQIVARITNTSLLQSKSKHSSFRQNSVIIVAQYTFSILLIIAVLVFYRQSNYLMSNSLGVSKGNVICMESVHQSIQKKFDVLKDELLKYNSIESVSGMMEPPGGEANDMFAFELEGYESSEQDISERVGVFPCDYSFPDVFNLSFLSGNTFSEGYLDNDGSGEYIINEAALHQFNYNDPNDIVGKQFQLIFKHEEISIPNGKIIGVVKDFHLSSMKSNDRPLVLFKRKNWWLLNFVIAYQPERKNEAIAAIQNTWNDLFPEYPFEYEHVENMYGKVYKTELLQVRLLSIFTFVALFICSMGMLGLSILHSQQRIKEIGVRKVNGARIIDILSMLNLVFVKWVIIAFVLAVPLSYLLIHKWLENFAYKTEISWWIFAVAGLLALGIALLTVSLQSWRAATRNPVEALRYE